MTDHPTEQKLSAYHDGEIAGDEREMLAGHLAWCQVCLRQLEQLKQMSALVASSAPDGISQIALRRLHNKLDEVIDRGIERGLVRFAWEVSGVAAAILLVGSVWLARLGQPVSPMVPVSPAVPPWVSAQASVDPVVQDAPTPAAAWYLADARNTSDASP
jgi:anti-sigma factor RsiW